VDKITATINTALAELFVWLKPSGINMTLRITALKGGAIDGGGFSTALSYTLPSVANLPKGWQHCEGKQSFSRGDTFFKGVTTNKVQVS
jgi:hypothetical protein